MLLNLDFPLRRQGTARLARVQRDLSSVQDARATVDEGIRQLAMDSGGFFSGKASSDPYVQGVVQCAPFNGALDIMVYYVMV